MGRIAVFSASMGAGHDGVARELARRLRAVGYTVDIYDLVTLLPFGLGRLLQATYRRQLALAPSSWQWLLDFMARWPAARTASTWLCCLSSRAMRRAVGEDTEVVVSTYPLAGQVLARLRRNGRLDAPIVTYLTDPSVHPLWIAPGTDLYLAAHKETAEQARALGAEAVSVVAPAVRREFRPPRQASERAAERLKWGLPRCARIAAVLSGSWGVGEIDIAAREIAASGLAIPVVVCGQNSDLFERLQDLRPGLVLGWVNDMASLLRACDLVVLNSGGLGFLEAQASGLPVLSYRCLAGHGLANAETLEAAGLARWVRSRAELAGALAGPAEDLGAGFAALDGVGEVDPVVPIAALGGIALDELAEWPVAAG